MGSKKKIYFSGLIFGILNLALIILLIFPLLRAIEKNSQDLISQKKDLTLVSTKKENFKNLEKVYQVNQKNLEKINSLFVDPETPIDFISFLEETAKDSQASIKISLASGKKEESDFGPTLSLNILLESSFPNFLKFLEKLENSPYLIEILNLNIKRSGEKTPGLISATFPIRVLTR